jgi:hypothetical protein
LSTLAVEGSSAVGTSRMATALRYFDLVLLAAALPVFIAADLPMVAYLVIAIVWLAQHGVELLTNRAVRRAAARGDRTAAMGWVGATTLARVWTVALAVLLVGVLSSKEAGLAAALLSAVLFTVHLGGRLLSRFVAPPEEPGPV